MKTLIIAHNDLDGLFSAIGFVACDSGITDKLVVDYNEYLKNYDLVILGITQENLFKKLEKLGYNIDNYQKLVMVDYSSNLETMQKLKNKFNNNFIWIDHHENIYLETEKQINIEGLRNKENSAAILVYKYFNKEPPLVSRYVEDMDIWKWQLENSEEILSTIDIILKNTVKGSIFDYNLVDFSVCFSFLENDYFLDKKASLIEKGKIISNVQKENARSDLLFARKCLFEGYKTLIVNSSIKASIFSLIVFNFEKYKEIEQILVWSKNHKKNENKFSIRSKEHDCNIIAQKYSGNGHKQASGFIIKNLDEFEKNLE